MTTLLLSGLMMYLIGSLPGSLLLARWRGWADPRSAGSGNAGSTNILRMHGRGPAAAVFLLDAGKAALALAIGQQLQPESEIAPLCLDWLWLLAVVLGHVYPVFYAFRGGKGMAAFIGGVAWLQPQITALVFLLVLPVLILSRRSSMASLLALLLYFPLGLLAAPADQLDCQLWGAGITISVILFAHRANIRRLAAGKEPAL